MKKILIITILLAVSINCKKKQNQELKEKYSDFPPKEMLIQANGGLRLRETPDINGKILTVIPNGSTIKTYGNVLQDEIHDGKEGKWIRVKYLHHSGFVFSGFLMERLNFADFQSDTDILKQIESILKFKINYNFQISEDYRDKNNYSTNFEIVKDITYKDYRAISISPTINGCDFYAGAICYNLILKNNTLIFHDLNSDSIGMLQDLKDEKFSFLIEAGCGAECDFSYQATKYEFNLDNEKLYKIQNYTSSTECVEEIDQFTEDCIKCSNDFNYSNYSKTISQEIDFNRNVIKTEVSEKFDKK